jgi:hypothetical protein
LTTKHLRFKIKRKSKIKNNNNNNFAPFEWYMMPYYSFQLFGLWAKARKRIHKEEISKHEFKNFKKLQCIVSCLFKTFDGSIETLRVVFKITIGKPVLISNYIPTRNLCIH